MTLPQGTISMAAPSWHAGCRPAYGTPRSDPGKRSILDQFDAGDAACWCFRRIARIDHVVVDKTGTLTLGRPELIGTRTDVVEPPGRDRRAARVAWARPRSAPS